MGKKDLTERRIFEFNDVFSDAVNGLLFAGEEVVKEDELEDVYAKSNFITDSRKLAYQERDVSKLWKKEGVIISLLGLENQTKIDKNMIFRVLGYDGVSYKSQLVKIETIKRKINRLKNKTDKKSINIKMKLEEELKSMPDIYPVLTVILYYGKEQWESPLSLKERLNIPEGLKVLMPDYKVNVYNLGAMPDEEIERLKGDFKIIVDFLKNGDNLKVKEENITHLPEMLDFFEAFAGDERFEELRENIINSYKESRGEGMCDIKAVLDKIENRGIEQGIARGRLEALLSAIKKLMSNMKLNLEQALDAVGISEEEKPKYRELIGKADN